MWQSTWFCWPNGVHICTRVCFRLNFHNIDNVNAMFNVNPKCWLSSVPNVLHYIAVMSMPLMRKTGHRERNEKKTTTLTYTFIPN